eukprot:8313927-Pyramimonas_sp.AAC.1
MGTLEGLPRPTSRVVSAWIGGLLKGGIIGVSVYLPWGEGAGAQGRQILMQLGESLYTSGKPIVIGGDFNSTADEIRGLGILEKFGGVIVQPGQPTCRVGKEWRTIDFFIVSGGLVPAV